jgi:putative transposase
VDPYGHRRAGQVSLSDRAHRRPAVADITGGRQDIANPKHFARKRRKLARLEREKARRVRSSSNRAKSRRKIAVRHGKVARARRDYHHKQALALVRENQALYVEDLNIAGMTRNRRLAGAIHDAGWGQFIRLLLQKAERFGRVVHAVDRWLPSSKTCSTCGQVVDIMPLSLDPPTIMETVAAVRRVLGWPSPLRGPGA